VSFLIRQIFSWEFIGLAIGSVCEQLEFWGGICFDVLDLIFDWEDEWQ
jgi:hypothetical protein